jgi:hypothetical protein
VLRSGEARQSFGRQRAQQRGLVGKVAIDRGRADARCAGDLAQPDVVAAALFEQSQALVDQRRAQVAVVVGTLFSSVMLTLLPSLPM